MFVFGDIVHVEHFPYSEKPETKNRYAVIASVGDLQDGDYVLAQITSTIRGDKYSILLDNNNIITPLKNPSEIRVHKLWTGNKKMLSTMPYGKLTTKGEIALKDKLKTVIAQ